MHDDATNKMIKENLTDAIDWFELIPKLPWKEAARLDILKHNMTDDEWDQEVELVKARLGIT